VNCIHLAQDKVEWWALVDTVMNSEVFTATNMNITVFWDVAPGSLVDTEPCWRQ
jgi:3-methyladenine DNA glycosylase AlkD